MQSLLGEWSRRSARKPLSQTIPTETLPKAIGCMTETSKVGDALSRRLDGTRPNRGKDRAASEISRQPAIHGRDLKGRVRSTCNVERATYPPSTLLPRASRLIPSHLAPRASSPHASRLTPRASRLAPHPLSPLASHLSPHPLTPRASRLIPSRLAPHPLTPHASRLAPHPLTPRASRLAPLTSPLIPSRLAPLASRLIPSRLSPHSYRSASIGRSRAARRAG